MAEDRSVLDRPAAPPDAAVAYGKHPDQVIDVWYGGGAAPVVVLLHGGFWRPQWDRTHLRPMAEALRHAGWTVAVPEYRREPGNPDVTVADVRAALDRLPAALAGRYDEGHGPVPVVAGHSAGGQLALLAATAPWHGPADPLLRGVLALAPVADLVLAERLDLDDGAVVDFLGTSAPARADLDPVRLGEPVVPVTVLHGTADDRVPPEVSASYAEGRQAARLVTAPGADHFALIDPASAAWTLVIDELRKLSQ
jgi:acetyl esterase/lipase